MRPCRHLLFFLSGLGSISRLIGAIQSKTHHQYRWRSSLLSLSKPQTWKTMSPGEAVSLLYELAANDIHIDGLASASSQALSALGDMYTPHECAMLLWASLRLNLNTSYISTSFLLHRATSSLGAFGSPNPSDVCVATYAAVQIGRQSLYPFMVDIPPIIYSPGFIENQTKESLIVLLRAFPPPPAPVYLSIYKSEHSNRKSHTERYKYDKKTFSAVEAIGKGLRIQIERTYLMNTVTSTSSSVGTNDVKFLKDMCYLCGVYRLEFPLGPLVQAIFMQLDMLKCDDIIFFLDCINSFSFVKAMPPTLMKSLLARISELNYFSIFCRTNDEGISSRKGDTILFYTRFLGCPSPMIAWLTHAISKEREKLRTVLVGMCDHNEEGTIGCTNGSNGSINNKSDSQRSTSRLLSVFNPHQLVCFIRLLLVCQDTLGHCLLSPTYSYYSQQLVSQEVYNDIITPNDHTIRDQQQFFDTLQVHLFGVACDLDLRDSLLSLKAIGELSRRYHLLPAYPAIDRLKKQFYYTWNACHSLLLHGNTLDLLQLFPQHDSRSSESMSSTGFSFEPFEPDYLSPMSYHDEDTEGSHRPNKPPYSTIIAHMLEESLTQFAVLLPKHFGISDHDKEMLQQQYHCIIDDNYRGNGTDEGDVIANLYSQPNEYHRKGSHDYTSERCPKSMHAINCIESSTLHKSGRLSRLTEAMLSIGVT
eukprot:Tbor_TRINITY_DN5589_c0_g1::TRINITY_DN5589_c0_g1_i1::g.12994::m.12994